MDILLVPLFIGVCILGILLLPALLLYALPIHCDVAFVQKEDRRERTITVSWALAGIRIVQGRGKSTTWILVGGKGVYSITAADDQNRGAEPPFTGANLSRTEISHFLLHSVMPMGRFAVAVFRQIRIDEVRGKVRIGLGDPVSTGMMYGGYWASRFAMNASRIFIVMEPVFGPRIAEGGLTIRLKLRHPLVILIEAVRLIRNPDVRGLMKSFQPPRSRGAEA